MWVLVVMRLSYDLQRWIVYDIHNTIKYSFSILAEGGVIVRQSIPSLLVVKVCLQKLLIIQHHHRVILRVGSQLTRQTPFL